MNPRLLAPILLFLVAASGPHLARAATDELVAAGAVWRYLDDGSDQGTAWTSPAFDDTAWASGPAQLGYGDGDEATVVSFGGDPGNKFVATYYRLSFAVADPSAYAVASLELLRDDGAVVHLNGAELHRSNMPAGPIAFSTLASSAISGAGESAFETVAFSPSLLVAGTNVLAVEIHQSDPASSDTSFDLRLTASDAATLVRGPYLQRATPTSIVARWRTDVPAVGRVRFGAAPGALGSFADEAAATTEHVVEISGLSPDTEYFYSIGDPTGVLAGDDADHRFRTPPPAGPARPFRVWVAGDSGTADANAAAVRDAWLARAATRDADLWLMLGDNAYGSGTDPQYQAAVFDMYPTILRRIPLWPTLGNHDAASASSTTQSGVYYDVFTLPTAAEAGGLASGTEAYYSFDFANVHFVCLDSQDTDRSPGGAMLTWLQADLAATAREWIVAFFHHPPYTKGSHDSDNVFDSSGRMRDMRENALPILEAAGVDLVLTGHSHSYERSFLLDGHYDVSSTLVPAMILNGGDGDPAGDGAYEKPTLGAGANEGAVYAVAGSSGQVTFAPLGHPVMRVSLLSLGSMILDFDGARLEAAFVDASGAIADRFAISKGLVARFDGATSTFAESAGTIDVGVLLSAPAPPGGATADYAAVGGTATGGGIDYATLGTGTLAFPEGEAKASFQVQIANDGAFEVPETVLLELSSPVGAGVGAPAVHELTILDDDSNAARIPLATFEQ